MPNIPIHVDPPTTPRPNTKPQGSKNVIHTWLPESDRWLHEALDKLACKMTFEEGIQTSKSDLVRAALVSIYGHLKP